MKTFIKNLGIAAMWTLCVLAVGFGITALTQRSAKAFDSRASFPVQVFKADNGTIVGSIDNSGNLTVLGTLTANSISGTTATLTDITNAAKTRIDIGPTTRYALQGTNGASGAIQVNNANGTTNLVVFYGGILVSNIANYHQ